MISFLQLAQVYNVQMSN